MMSTYEIELPEPTRSLCDCCGGLTVRMTRFVSRNAEPYAVYYAAYTNAPQHGELSMLISLGEWGEGSTAPQRSAFFCRVRPSGDSYELMLGDAAKSAWGDVEAVGTKLSRDQALAHPMKATAFSMVDDAFRRDPTMRGFLERIHCGDVAAPLERNFAMPDDVFALDDARNTRAVVGRNLVVLDGEAHFVRCLLPIDVEEYGPWCVGVWVEVSKADYEHAAKVWDDEALYPKLEFHGRLANDVAADIGLPLAPRAELHVRVHAVDDLPQVSPPPGLNRQWPKDDFERFAVTRGFL
ncbi:MAG: DUF2199 domain-containing protein [Myxococcaceae bacterium]|nr:DUF2199 domain-containing protein [Myxococcaceae bacterium]